MLQELGRLEEAEKSYNRAIALKSDYAEAHYNLGFFFYSAKDYGKASEQFALSNFGKSKLYLLKCLFERNEETLFLDQMDFLIGQNEVHPMMGSLGYRSRLKFGEERPNLFCEEPLKYVFKIDLKDQYDFEKVFVDEINAVLRKSRPPNRKQRLLTHGYQASGNLFQLERDATQEIQNIIRSEIERYRAHFEGSNEGLITHWPARYNINARLIAMKNGGELGAHIHESGWISGTVYINVPPKSKADSGNLVVSLGEEKDAVDPRKNTREVVDVETGNMVLFPSSLTHHTIPFESDEERICIAFDVVPE